MSNGRIAILIPSLGRRTLFDRWYESFKEKSTSGLCDIFLWNVDTDPKLPEYNNLPNDVTRHIGPREHEYFGFVPSCNSLAGLHPEYSFFASSEDDMIFLRRDWDCEAVASFTDGKAKVIKLHDAAETVESYIVNDKWINATGYFHFPMFPGYGCTAIRELATRLDRYQVSSNGPVFRHEVQTRDGFCSGTFETMEPERRSAALTEQYIYYKWLKNGGIDNEVERIRKNIRA